ncbi:MAG: hypothetical protein J5651_00400 [Salinivirgaceae bacterium]|nr:hypothetical protein [Salinivirgaceae bacterium]
MKRLITPKERRSYDEVLEFVQAFVDYYYDDEPVEPTEETDAHRLARFLPDLKGLFEKMQKRLNLVIFEEREKALAEGCQLSQTELKDKIFMAAKEARESVNPNYKYAVVDIGLERECWLTDDIDAAMRKAHTLAIVYDGFYYVLKIFKAKDNSYQTMIEGCYERNGGYMDRHGDNYLHFDFIARKLGDENIHKIQ